MLIGVALLVSAWIEIKVCGGSNRKLNVALLVSAWIEIQKGLGVHIVMSGRTPRECVD